MKLLLVDAGNSRVKWALTQGNDWLHREVLDNAQAAMLPAVFAGLPVPDRILVSNVAGPNRVQQLQHACRRWSCPLEFVTARREQCGVHNCYEQPGQLGSDRWAALIAAWQLERAACLVVNCGTATTVDALSATGDFLGGLILPGIQMMQRTLVTDTANLVAGAGSWREFPRNTADALFTGAVQATAGAIRMQFASLSGQGSARCLLSGGDAGLIEEHLALPVVRVEDLVLRGLHHIGLTMETE